MHRIGHLPFTDSHKSWQEYVNRCTQESFCSAVLKFFCILGHFAPKKTDFGTYFGNHGQLLWSITWLWYDAKRCLPWEFFWHVLCWIVSIQLSKNVSFRNGGHPHFPNCRGNFRRLSHISIIIAVLHIDQLRFLPTLAVGFRVSLQFLVTFVLLVLFSNHNFQQDNSFTVC